MRRISLAFLIGVVLVLPARSASGQPAVYITATAFADVKRFGTNQTVVYTGETQPSFDGTGAAGGLRIGTFVSSQWSLELSVDKGAKTTVKLPATYVQPLADLPVRFPQLKASTRFLTVSTVVVFHTRPHGPVRLGYLGGFNFVRGTYKSDYPYYGYPYILSTAAAISAATAIAPSPAIYPPPVPSVSTLTQTDLTGSAIVGFEAAIELTKQLAVVPEVRVLTFKSVNSGQGVFLARPGVGVRWSF